MPFTPTTQHIMTVIEMQPGQEAPPGAQWVRVIAGRDGWELEGNIPDLPNVLSKYGVYQERFEAEQAGLGLARERRCRLLYVERH